MVPSMWFGIAILLVVDIRIRALQQKDPSPHRCHQCSTNSTACLNLTVIECPSDRPLCATLATSPNFTSELTCAATQKNPCFLSNSADAFSLICTCEEDLCNAPFFKDVQSHLLDFTTSNFTKNNSSDYTEEFFKLYYANVTEDQLYKKITVESPPTTERPMSSSSHLSTVSTVANTHTTLIHTVAEHLPRAEAFKHEPTALSEDDEDASEGSGSYEETRSQRQPASDPADPSSYLPANENKASPLLATFFVTTPIFMHFLA